MGVKVREKPKNSGNWWIFIDHQGRRKAKKIGRDKRVALEVAKKIEARLVLGDMKLISDNSIQKSEVSTFEEYATTWIKVTVPATCKPSTLKDYEIILNKHVLPEIGKKPVNEISRLMVKQSLMKKINQGYAKLKVEFKEGDKSFVTDTKESGVTDAHYVRIKVLNKGRQIAKQCRSYLVNVEKWKSKTGKFEPTIYCDSLPLPWSARTNTIDYPALDMPRDINQFIDILSTRSSESDYKIMVQPRLYRYESLFKEHGKFRYTVLVSGDNFKPISAKVVFDWRGDWDNFFVTAG
jgi:hypothetical protein